MMTEELEQYLLAYCRDYMLQEERQALAQLSLTAWGRESYADKALSFPRMEEQFGFKNDRAIALVNLGIEVLRTKIAERILAEHREAVLNFCPKCAKLARTPRAKQCRYCGHDWHEKPLPDA